MMYYNEMSPLKRFWAKHEKKVAVAAFVGLFMYAGILITSDKQPSSNYNHKTKTLGTRIENFFDNIRDVLDGDPNTKSNTASPFSNIEKRL